MGKGDKTMGKKTSSAAFEHVTYNIDFALAAFKEGFDVCVCHIEDDDIKMWSLEDIEDAEGHLFSIKEWDATYDT